MTVAGRAHQFDVALGVQHEVLRLQVPVQDALAMQIIESFCDTADAEFGRGLVKTAPEDRKNSFWLFADRR